MPHSVCSTVCRGKPVDGCTNRLSPCRPISCTHALAAAAERRIEYIYVYTPHTHTRTPTARTLSYQRENQCGSATRHLSDAVFFCTDARCDGVVGVVARMTRACDVLCTAYYMRGGRTARGGCCARKRLLTQSICVGVGLRGKDIFPTCVHILRQQQRHNQQHAHDAHTQKKKRSSHIDA